MIETSTAIGAASRRRASRAPGGRRTAWGGGRPPVSRAPPVNRLARPPRSEEARDDRPEDREGRLVLDRLRRAVDRPQGVLRFGVERVVGERLADRALARAEALGDLLRVARGLAQVVHGLAHLAVEPVVLREQLAER